MRISDWRSDVCSSDLPWAPYVYEENGQVRRLDYETTAIVFKRLGIDVQWQLLPWKRCLAMLEQGLADGALDIFHSNERDAMLLYPSEPLSDVEFVMFYANARPHPFRTLDDLGGLTVGTSPGYLYSQAFSESPLFKRETAPTHEANFGKLQQIGRASCRERVCQLRVDLGGRRIIKKKNA